MQRLLAHPADQPLVHVDHSHRKSTATSTATPEAAATGQTVMVPDWVIRQVQPDWREFGDGTVLRSMKLPLNSTTLGNISEVPWTFGLGTEEIPYYGDARDGDDDKQFDIMRRYKTCYTYRDMSSVVKSMENMNALSRRLSFAVSQLDELEPEGRPDPFYLPMATVIPDADDPNKKLVRFSMRFVASDGYASRGYQFTKEGKHGLAGPFRKPAGYERIGPLYMTMPVQMPEDELDTTDERMGDNVRKDLLTLEFYKKHEEYVWEGGWHGKQRNR